MFINILVPKLRGLLYRAILVGKEMTLLEYAEFTKYEGILLCQNSSTAKFLMISSVS